MDDILTRVMRSLETHRNCLVCGKLFPVTSRGRIYCTSKCRRKGGREAERKREVSERLDQLTKEASQLTQDIDSPAERMYPDESAPLTPPPAPTFEPPNTPYESFADRMLREATKDKGK